MSDGLTSMLKKLRLSGLGESLEIRLHEASSRGLTHREFLELALQDELLVRDGRQISRRIATACFLDVKRLEDFDFRFKASIKKNRIFDLATCHFVRDKRDVLWLGPLGTRKSHLCQSIGVAAIRSGFTVYYRSIFDTVRDFLHDEAMEGHEKILQRYRADRTRVISSRHEFLMLANQFRTPQCTRRSIGLSTIDRLREPEPECGTGRRVDGG